MTEPTLPTLDEWRRLYTAAGVFRELAPWDWMYDDELFVVADPASGERFYCCVMGSLGEMLALNAYRGAAGYASYRRIQETGPPQAESARQSMEVAFNQNCLMASFEGREMQDDEDRALIRQLGLRFRGRQAWPLFRSYRPGYVPWFLDGAEARMLAVCLEQAVALCQQAGQAGHLRRRAGKLPGRLPEVDSSGQMRFKDGWATPPAPVAAEPLAPPPLDELRIQRLRKRCQKSPGSLEMDWVQLPQPVADGERPFYPCAVSVIDSDSGMVLGVNLVGPGIDPALPAELLLNAMEQSGQIPLRVLARRAQILQLLSEVARKLGLRLEETASMGATDHFQQHLLRDYAGAH